MGFVRIVYYIWYVVIDYLLVAEGVDEGDEVADEVEDGVGGNISGDIGVAVATEVGGDAPVAGGGEGLYLVAPRVP